MLKAIINKMKRHIFFIKKEFDFLYFYCYPEIIFVVKYVTIKRENQ